MAEAPHATAALRRGAAVREFERRSESRLFRRRHLRRPDHRSGQTFWARCHRPQLRFGLQGEPRCLGRRGPQLGVRYVVQGSVQRAGEQTRINSQLVDTKTGDHLWADRFDRRAVEVFAVQDEMSRDIIKSLGLTPTASETQRIARPPTANLRANRATRTSIPLWSSISPPVK